MTRPWEYVTDAGRLRELAAEWADATVIGVDTESDSFFHYQERVCLIQVTVLGRDLIIDPLAIEDMSPMEPVLADPGVWKILHGADYDIASMKRDYQFEITPVFDTMIAAQALGYERYSLADLVAHFFDVKLDKKYQRQDWSRRPLKEEHLEYARLDSHYLPELHELLRDEVAAAGRGAQVAEECRLIEQRERPVHAFDPNDFLRIRGSGKLDERGKRVLRALYVMRDGMARDRDRPHFKVIGNDALLRVAARPPRNHAQLERLLGKKHHVVRRHAPAVVEACQTGLADQSAVPRSRPDARPHRRLSGPEETRTFEALRDWRNREAKTRGIEAGVLMSNAVLQEIAAARVRRVEDLKSLDPMRDWQRSEFGEAILELVRGVNPG